MKTANNSRKRTSGPKMEMNAEPPSKLDEAPSPMALAGSYSTGVEDRMAVHAPPSAEAPTLISVSSIIPWEHNPRTFVNDDRFLELRQSVKKHGVIQNLLLRYAPNGMLQIVAGERRFRAAEAEGLEKVPAIIRNLSDKEAFEIALLENLQREDMPVFDEAQAFNRMQTEYGVGPEDIAAKIGKAPAYVRQRLLLCQVLPEVRALYEGTKLTVGAVYELARVPSEIQRQYCEDHVRHEDGIQTAIMVREVLREEYLNERNLARAPFDIKDADLVPAAGACGPCPKNSMAQRELFSDENPQDAGHCMDAACWKQKIEARWKNAKEQAASSGAKVVQGEAATKFVNRYGQAKSGMMSLDSPCYEAPVQEDRPTQNKGRLGGLMGAGYRTYRELVEPVLKNNAKDLVLVRSPDRPDQIKELIPASRLAELLKEAGHDKLAKSRAVAPPKEDPSALARQKQRELQEKAHGRAKKEAIAMLGATVQSLCAVNFPKSKAGDQTPLALILRELICLKWTRKGLYCATRRGLGEEGVQDHYQLSDRAPAPDKRLQALSIPELFGLLCELGLELQSQYGLSGRARGALAAAGIKIKDLEKKCLADLRPPTKKEKAAVTKATKGKAPPKASHKRCDLKK